MFESDLQFPHSYAIAEPPELSGSGKSELPLHYFPLPENRPEPDGVWIKFCPQLNQEWVGVFAGGYASPPAISKILSTPDPMRACVISRGQAFLVNSCKPSDWEVVPILPITYACAVPQHQFLLLADFSRVTAWNKGIVSQVRFAFDGLTFTTVKPDLIEGYGYDPASAANKSFVIQTQTGKVRRFELPRFNSRFWAVNRLTGRYGQASKPVELDL